MKLFTNLFLSLVLALITSQVSAQIKVWNNNNVSLGYAGSAPSFKLSVNGSLNVVPQGANWSINMIDRGSPYSGDPAILAQFSNAMHIGHDKNLVYRGYFNRLYYVNLVKMSDQSIKTNIVEWNESALNKLSSINAYRYDLKPDFMANTEESRLEEIKPELENQIGLIAQEVQAEFPEVVKVAYTDAEGKDILGVEYETLVPILIEAIKEQQAMIEELKTKVTALENE